MEDESQLRQSSSTAKHQNTAVNDQNKSQPAGPPDGGWEAWLQVLGSFILFCITWFAQLQSHLHALHLTIAR